MNFKSILSNRLSAAEIDILRFDLLADRTKVEEVFQLIFQNPEKVAWQAAWLCEKVSEADVMMFSDEDYEQLLNFTLVNNKSGLQRLCLSILLNLPIRKPISVEFINNCFEQMVCAKQPVGVQVLSMKILQRIAIVEPVFAYELLACLESLDFTDFSPGFIAARRNVSKMLKISTKNLS